MQDITAECLGMERGISGSIGRLEAVEFKIRKKEDDLKILEERYNEMKFEIGSKKFEELIVKESDFLGFQKMKTEKTLMNFEKTFKIQKSQLLKNKSEIESKSKHITELNTKIESLRKEIHFLKTKNSVLLTNPVNFAFEKKKYLNSVQNTLEKAIRFEKLNHDLRIDSHQQMLSELIKIAEKVAHKNNIPPSAFEEIFKDSNKTAQVFNLLRFGERKSTQPESNDIENNRRNKLRK